MAEAGNLSSETRSRVAEQQPWALLDICEEQNLEIPRYGTREKGDPLANVLPRVPHKPPEPPHATREIPRDCPKLHPGTQAELLRTHMRTQKPPVQLCFSVNPSGPHGCSGKSEPSGADTGGFGDTWASAMESYAK